MTTSNIDELLERDTFQGMTDAEIQAVIDFHVENASASKAILETRERNSAALDALVVIAERKLAILEEAHAAALETKPKLASSSPVLEAN